MRAQVQFFTWTSSIRALTQLSPRQGDGWFPQILYDCIQQHNWTLGMTVPVALLSTCFIFFIVPPLSGRLNLLLELACSFSARLRCYVLVCSPK